MLLVGCVQLRNGGPIYIWWIRHRIHRFSHWQSDRMHGTGEQRKDLCSNEIRANRWSEQPRIVSRNERWAGRLCWMWPFDTGKWTQTYTKILINSCKRPKCNGQFHRSNQRPADSLSQFSVLNSHSLEKEEKKTHSNFILRFNFSIRIDFIYQLLRNDGMPHACSVMYASNYLKVKRHVFRVVETYIVKATITGMELS